MKTNIYKSIVTSVVFGNVIAFPVTAANFDWDIYLVDPTPYYILAAESLGLLIAAAIFVYDWFYRADKPLIEKAKQSLKKPRKTTTTTKS